MFFLRLLYACALLTAMLSVGFSRADEPKKPEFRSVTINVTLQAPAGTPQAGIPIAVLGRRAGHPPKTDASGHVQIACEIPSDLTSAWLTMVPLIDPLNYYDGRDDDVRRFNALTAAWAFKELYEVPLDATVSTYSITIVGQPSVTVSGRILRAGRSPEDDVIATVGREGGQPMFSQPEQTTGNFTLGGNLRGQAVTLFIVSEVDEQIIPLDLTAEQMQADVALGDITIPARPTGRRADATFTNLAQVRRSAKWPWGGNLGSTFVASDGSKVFAGSLVAGTQAIVRARGGAALPELPPGTYFVCPGYAGRNREATRLYKLLRAGRATEVEAAGVPKLVIPNDGQTTPVPITVDALATIQAVGGIK